MWAFLFLWLILTISAFLLIVGRCTFIIYIIFTLPILITFTYFIFKNDTSQSTNNRKVFFTNFKFGGHRGSPVKAPENTIESFEKAKEEGCDLVEFDVHMTSDGVPIIMHDETTGRTSKVDMKVSETNWEQLKNITLNSVDGISAKITTLNATIEWCLKNDIKMLFDIKDDNISLINKLAAVIKSYNLYDKVLVSSFNPVVPWRLKKLDSKIITGLTYDRSYYSYRDDFRAKPFTTNIFYHWFNEILDEINMIISPLYVLPKFLGVDVMMLSYKLISENTVREAHEKGFSVIAWTVNDVDYMRILVKLHVPFLTDVSYEVDNAMFMRTPSRELA